MGVSNMKKLVEESNILEDVKFKNSSVVIDGPNLYYNLYFNSKPKLDQQHGGDYSAFRELVRRFFSNLQQCNITALVVLDGGSSAMKGKTIGDRMKEKLKKAKRISESKAGSWDNILPPMAKDVFIQILQEMNIEMQQCLGEADQTAAMWANERKCPVLSKDSDFYIFDIQEGFLYTDQFNWESVEGGAILAKRYRISRFCEIFKIKCKQMPIFAAISGNDYSRLDDKGVLTRLYHQPQQPGGYHANRQRFILNFLSQYKARTIEEAVRAALQLIGETRKEEVKKFVDSAQTYDLVEPPNPDLPEWMIHEVQNGRLTSFVTIVADKSMTLTPLVEDFSQPSSYEASHRIRQFFYGLLVGSEPFTEYDRRGTEDLCPNAVTPITPRVTPKDLQRLKLEHLNEAPEDLRRKVFFEALRCSSPENIPDRLKLTLIVTRFWFQYRQQNSPGSLNKSCLQALLLGFLYGEDDAEHQFKAKLDGLKSGGRALQPAVAHAFSQWQNCMRHSLHLNQLLGRPLPEPQCYRLYCGPLIHTLQHVLQESTTAFEELRNLLDEGRRDLLDNSLQFTGS
ncbi:PREDICTED: protein asteroid homolog 1-like [Cyprinodon variegatus]|uniref:protein asteroid homolog 1-like n=1 Tax=Cyprinodon variegatus TaxID=28743 RepID=UPI000742C253|nr:PREDICTED: protein asteroid homolog 1-like [Cyprinodon variegatus]